MIKNNSSRSAFTLLELLLVIAIISVMAGLVVFSLRPAVVLQNANSTKGKQNANDIKKAIDTYAVDNGGSVSALFAGLSGEAYYDICKEGITDASCVNLTILVTQKKLSNIPLDIPNAGTLTTGYKLYYNATTGKSNVITKTEYLALGGPGCPTGYVKVPGNLALYQTNDFCVMKYEAKNVGGVATSQAALTPWAFINQTDAITACSNVGAHLITNKEWMTLERNIDQLASNWTGNAVGSGQLFSGHNDGDPWGNFAAGADNDPYNNTNNTSPSGQRRTHNLSNGEVVWDLSGNLWEWNSDTILGKNQPTSASPGWTFRELTDITAYGSLSYDLFRPTNAAWNTAQGFGKVYTDGTSTNNLSYSVVRGGNWVNGTNYVGILETAMDVTSSASGNHIGFRCVLTL